MWVLALLGCALSAESEVAVDGDAVVVTTTTRPGAEVVVDGTRKAAGDDGVVVHRLARPPEGTHDVAVAVFDGSEEASATATYTYDPAPYAHLVGCEPGAIQVDVALGGESRACGVIDDVLTLHVDVPVDAEATVDGVALEPRDDGVALATVALGDRFWDLPITVLVAPADAEATVEVRVARPGHDPLAVEARLQLSGWVTDEVRERWGEPDRADGAPDDLAFDGGTALLLGEPRTLVGDTSGAIRDLDLVARRSTRDRKLGMCGPYGTYTMGSTQPTGQIYADHVARDVVIEAWPVGGSDVDETVVRARSASCPFSVETSFWGASKGSAMPVVEKVDEAKVAAAIEALVD